MPSLQSQLIIFAIRNRHFLRFRSKRETWDDLTSIPDFRQQCEAGARRMKLPDGIEVLPLTIDGVTGIANRQAEWLIPDGATKDKVVLYTVGGGYVSGSCTDHRAMVAKITRGSGVTTLLFDHRLAPGRSFPCCT
jgi:epsilon-lactone hydrolase